MLSSEALGILLLHHAPHTFCCLPLSAPQVALLLGGACGVMAVLLQRSWAEQARLAALLTKRETDLARLVGLRDVLCWAGLLMS